MIGSVLALFLAATTWEIHTVKGDNPAEEITFAAVASQGSVHDRFPIAMLSCINGKLVLSTTWPDGLPVGNVLVHAMRGTPDAFNEIGSPMLWTVRDVGNEIPIADSSALQTQQILAASRGATSIMLQVDGDKGRHEALFMLNGLPSAQAEITHRCLKKGPT